MSKLAAIYTRVSTLDQAREGYSLSAQARTLTDWCSANGYEVYKVYSDEGISGKDILHRPAMQALLAAAQQGAFNIVIVWALSRFTRSVQDMYVTLDLLQRSNVDFRSHTESFDTSTAIGRAMLGIVGVFAQMEREITSERVKAAARERVEQGYPPLNYVIGYRRCCKELIIVEDEAEVVRYIYQMYLRHKCLSAVSDLCAERGYHGKLGARITAWQAKRILTNPIYVGKLRFKCETYQGTHEPIINPQDWQRVQKLLAKSPRTPRGKR